MTNTLLSTGGVQGTTNFAQADKFLLSFSRLPTVTLMCQQANIPGVMVNSATQPTQGVDAPLPGNKFKFEDFQITFLIDENMYAWTTIFDWLQGIGFPDSNIEYQNLTLQQKLQLAGTQPQYSDAMLTYYSNVNSPILQVNFSKVFPVSLGGIQYDVKQPATQPMTCTGTFRYTRYQYTRFPSPTL